MDIWDAVCLQKEDTSKVHQLLDASGEFVFFFKLDGSIFGAPEESRIMYAKMKHPDEDMVGKWRKEANFMAVNLDDILDGHGSQRVIAYDDLKKMKVIDKETAAEELGKKGKEKK